MADVISGVQESTAAENVCRRQTLATVGSPVHSGNNHKSHCTPADGEQEQYQPREWRIGSEN